MLSRKRLSASVCGVARCIFIFACVVLLFRYPRYEHFQYLRAEKNSILKIEIVNLIHTAKFFILVLRSLLQSAELGNLAIMYIY